MKNHINILIIIFLGLLFSILIILPAFCVDFMPKYKDSIKNYGIGLYFGEGDAVVYAVYTLVVSHLGSLLQVLHGLVQLVHVGIGIA